MGMILLQVVQLPIRLTCVVETKKYSHSLLLHTPTSLEVKYSLLLETEVDMVTNFGSPDPHSFLMFLSHITIWCDHIVPQKLQSHRRPWSEAVVVYILPSDFPVVKAQILKSQNFG